jgi:hypothetical protein
MSIILRAGFCYAYNPAGIPNSSFFSTFFPFDTSKMSKIGSMPIFDLSFCCAKTPPKALETPPSLAAKASLFPPFPFLCALRS